MAVTFDRKLRYLIYVFVIVFLVYLIAENSHPINVRFIEIKGNSDKKEVNFTKLMNFYPAEFTNIYVFLLALVVVFGINIICCTELVEGLLQKNPSKIWPWLFFNGSVLIFAAAYVLTSDSFLGFIIHVFFVNLWMSVAMIWIEMMTENENKESEIMESKDVDCII